MPFVGGSGHAVSLNTAIPKLFVKDITTTTAVVYWANAPSARRTGFTLTLKNLTSGVTESPVTVLASDMDYTLATLTPSNQYEVTVVNLYGSDSSTPASLIFETTGVM